MTDFATLPSLPSVGGHTDAETLAWFRARPKHQNAKTMRMRDAAWARVDAGDRTFSPDQLFWLFKISVGDRKRQAASLLEASK